MVFGLLLVVVLAGVLAAGLAGVAAVSPDWWLAQDTPKSSDSSRMKRIMMGKKQRTDN